MAFNDFLNQTITIYTRGSYDRHGREVMTAGTNYIARFKKITKTRMLPNGQVLLVSARVHLNPEVSVAIDDRVDYDGIKYKIIGITKPVDGDGNVHHLIIELTEWVQT